MTTERSRGPSEDVLAARRIADLLQLRAEGMPDDVVYNYLADDGTPESTLTYQQLFDDARRVATLLREHVSPGDRVILLFGSGLEFVKAFMGCQVAGVVPVPVMPPRDATPSELGRVMAIMDDVGTNLIVTSEQLLMMGQAFIQGSNLHWMAVADLEGVAMTEPVPFQDAGDLALLQYTSGSTSRPRGVMVGHDNLMCNLADIYWAEGNSPETISVSWLPMSHDMGLIEGVLQPLYRGSPVYLMSPLAFLRQPLLWLEVISRVRATVSGGPNFAYDLVLRRIGEGEPPELDLSCWKFAYNGSEPVSAETIQTFTERFACRGLRPESMHALFGIAEATLGVTEGRHMQLPRFQQRVDSTDARTVVSCGVPAPHTEIVIVDPETHRALPEGEEGEIWLNGPCVTRGYWRQPEKTAEVFGAKVQGREESFLRTGDVGFLIDGELHISGRIKEVIITRGRNVYPQDMELTAQKAHSVIRAGGVVAFSIPGREEAAGVVAEIDKKVFKVGADESMLNEIAGAVRRAVTLAHGVPVEVMALVKPGSLPRTTSGKRQRLRVAKMWQSDKLDPLFVLEQSATSHDESLAEYVRDRVAAMLGVAPESLDESKTLAELGLDSMRTLELLIDAEAHFAGVSLATMLTSTLGELVRGVDHEASEQPWFDDAQLSDEIQCADVGELNHGRVLVTGATGFLGGTLVIEMLKSSNVQVVALVRDGMGPNGLSRLLESLSQKPGWNPDWAGRIEVVSGDISAPELGLDDEARNGLIGSLDAIYHCAAMVNWVYPYEALRETNVVGTEQLLRLASEGGTPFVYVSTAAVCWSLGCDVEVDEATDPMSYIGGVYLNYARTKAVAESLVRQAGARGLPTTIIRPGLIFSHAETGVHSPGDFLSALFKGCIEMGAAPDLDWSLEATTVDDVARIVTGHVRKEPGVNCLHIEPRRKRMWRGAVLWMALRGYDVELVDYDAWCERLEEHAQEPTAALRPLLSFFTRPVPGLGGLRLPQLFEETRRNPMNTAASRAATDPPASIDARLLEKTFDDLADRGYLPAAPKTRKPAGPVARESSRSAAGPAAREANRTGFTSAILEAVLNQAFDDPDLHLVNCSPVEWSGDEPAEHGLIGELASWKHGAAAGVKRVALTVARGGGEYSMTAVTKTQVPDIDTLDVGEAVASLCDPTLGELWQHNRPRNEAVRAHLREAALYQLEHPALDEVRPAFFGAADGSLILEDLSDLSRMNSAGETWSDNDIASALNGIAGVHAAWWEAPPEADWMSPPRELPEQRQFLEALANVALSEIGDSLGATGIVRYRELVASVASWSAAEEMMPQTLIHNDFSPRNTALRTDGRLCAYDWELARAGIAQRDLVEFLCFALPSDVGKDDVDRWVELHRRAIEERGAGPIDLETWRRGVGCALADFLVARLALFGMIHRFHRQPFLERVVKTWVRLDGFVGFDR